jgi:hypothetical protein
VCRSFLRKVKFRYNRHVFFVSSCCMPVLVLYQVLIYPLLIFAFLDTNSDTSSLALVERKTKGNTHILHKLKVGFVALVVVMGVSFYKSTLLLSLHLCRSMNCMIWVCPFSLLNMKLKIWIGKGIFLLNGFYKALVFRFICTVLIRGLWINNTQWG